MRCVKKSVLVLVLWVCASACKDTEHARGWRNLEPRLTKEWQPYRSVKTAGSTDEPCPDLIDTRDDAVRVLEQQPQCTDIAISSLQSFGADALSDVAAAYYIRAKREGREVDYLNAWDAAQRAVTARPSDPAATFNLALIQESLGLPVAAAASWESFLKLDDSAWADEARRHLAALHAPRPQWNREALAQALKARNRAMVRKLIAPFPTPALDYFEQDVLAADDADAAKLLAEELSLRLHGDRYVLDAAAAMARAHEGHAAFRDAVHTDADVTKFENAVRLLQRDGSPVWIAAELRHALKLPYPPPIAARALALLAPAEQLAAAKHYEHLLARIQAERAYFLEIDNRYLEELFGYDTAYKTFSRLRDTEMMASVERSRTGAYRTLGQRELSWREALQAVRHFPDVIDVRRKNAIMGEAAMSAAALNSPRAALLYQNAAIRMLQQQSRRLPPERVDLLRDHVTAVAIMRRARAEVELQLGEYGAADDDLREAIRLEPRLKRFATVLTAIQARIHEVRGRSLLRSNPRRAVEAFTEAMSIIPARELRTFRASLFSERAEAMQRAGLDGEADLENALRELRSEEANLLERRRTGEGEELWSGYFSRFDETYDRFIRHLMDGGAWERAFDYKERSQAFEPLNLILQNGVAPESFRKLVPDGQPMKLAALRPLLPEGTFLLQYSCLEDRTYTWIVSRDGAAAISQRARARDVVRWSNEIQRAVRQRDNNGFRRALQPPFVELLAAPLAAIAKMPGGNQVRRLVIVPDDAMHGLPFAALYDPETRQHLIQRLSLEFAPSATLYIFSLLRDEELKSAQPFSVLLVGDPAFNEQLDLARGLKRLPRAREEVEQIAAMYAPNAVVLSGAEATIPDFLTQARNKTIVHFAGHTVVNPHEPWHSVLLLAPSNNDSGAIDAKELLKQLKLDHTRLVVLSACSSAGGFPVGPEGVAPLVRPLITAGVPAVMGSLWDVEDATAETLSVSFYRHYGRDGADAAEALRRAQLDLLRSGNRGLQAVLAWAPFQVIGHGSSPFEPTQKRTSGGTHLGLHRTNSVHRDDRTHPQ